MLSFNKYIVYKLITIVSMNRSFRVEHFKYCNTSVDLIHRNLNRHFKQFLQMEASAKNAVLASVHTLSLIHI